MSIAFFVSRPETVPVGLPGTRTDDTAGLLRLSPSGLEPGSPVRVRRDAHVPRENKLRRSVGFGRSSGTMGSRGQRLVCRNEAVDNGHHAQLRLVARRPKTKSRHRYPYKQPPIGLADVLACPYLPTLRYSTRFLGPRTWRPLASSKQRTAICWGDLV